MLNLYYRNDSWIVKYNDISKLDYSLGSKIFTVKPPEAGQLWYGNTPIISESPYVASYQAESYQRIEKMQQNENRALSDYFKSQPEVNEPAFILQLQKALEKMQEDPHQKVIPIWELAQYRLNKKIPNTLTFEEKKEILIHSEEWNCWVNQHNNHLSPDELTEDNIQKEINTTGLHFGIEIMKNLQKLEWLPLATNSEICEIYIP